MVQISGKKNSTALVGKTTKIKVKLCSEEMFWSGLNDLYIWKWNTMNMIVPGSFIFLNFILFKKIVKKNVYCITVYNLRTDLGKKPSLILCRNFTQLHKKPLYCWNSEDLDIHNMSEIRSMMGIFVRHKAEWDVHEWSLEWLFLQLQSPGEKTNNNNNNK